ncbi:hypothetical protein HII31_00079 [Pseudocercospora fuligena]|uniref:Uncharacterized protein n=1 Tax=Pseudocercospora fuligena TaxID=685502 RepID=A0A8H6VNH8_9PEZI|nr:hypothetical protein HII31_00079 [Pseudocercospora fuligena]
MSRRSLSSTLISRLQELIKDARDLEQEEEEIGQKRESILQEIAQVEKNHERAMKDLRSKSRTRLSEIDAEIGTKEDAIKVLQQEIEELQRRKNGIVADDHDQELEVIQQDTNQRVSELELELKAFDEQLEKNRAKQEVSSSLREK